MRGHWIAWAGLAGSLAYIAYHHWSMAQGEAIPGGMAAGRAPESFDARQLNMGIAEELEHTPDPAVAQEIAMDHLAEDPLYYDKLARAGL
jgi:hypothetical protein